MLSVNDVLPQYPRTSRLVSQGPVIHLWAAWLIPLVLFHCGMGSAFAEETYTVQGGQGAFSITIDDPKISVILQLDGVMVRDTSTNEAWGVRSVPKFVNGAEVVEIVATDTTGKETRGSEFKIADGLRDPNEILKPLHGEPRVSHSALSDIRATLTVLRPGSGRPTNVLPENPSGPLSCLMPHPQCLRPVLRSGRRCVGPRTGGPSGSADCFWL